MVLSFILPIDHIPITLLDPNSVICKYTLLPNYTNEPQPQGGGNKTRKNRQHQYMREIKDNRTHLFNKEMEILNSIRNFKNGHIDNDNTKKQFMKAVKRG